jgi:GTP cyclohydrolase IA
MDELNAGKRKAVSCEAAESTSVDTSACRSGSSASTPTSTPVHTPHLSPPRALDPGDDDGADSALPPAKKKTKRLSYEERLQRITDAARVILACLDDDPEREGLIKTPGRYAKAILDMTSGYQLSAAAVLGDAQFDENHSEMVLVRDIDVFSQCEHHLLPFHGRCHIAYVPSGPVVGLSKLARIVDVYSHRLQVQERLTTQVADAVLHATRARGVMVYMTCTHMCMVMRGVQKVGAVTVTTAARGCYRDDASLRQEFIAMVTSSKQ